MKKIKVRKEVVRCADCKRPKDFLYLSGFSYGQRLIFLNEATEYAYVDLIEDKHFENYINIVKGILKEMCVEISNGMLNKAINETFGITCDRINGNIVDFSKRQRKCCYCGSAEFERNMIEPEALIEIEVSLVSHNDWEGLTEEEKKKLVTSELEKRGII